MEKECQNTNSIIEAANGNETKKPENVIKAEISIEVTGEETPKKRTNKYEHWGAIALLSFVVWVGCMVYCACNNQSVNGVLVLVGSSAMLFYSLGQMSFLSSDERIGNAF